jgi:hypothetical protein
MDNFTISIFGNKIFLEILNELKLFSKFKIDFYEDFDLLTKNIKKKNQLYVLFINQLNQKIFDNNKIFNYPCVYILDASIKRAQYLSDLSEHLNQPFSIIEFNKKITRLIAKNEFKENSLIYLNEYIIDKNERKIKKNDLELQLSEKEINFLILFSKNKEPISKILVLKSVWNYSAESETHTVETHIHRLRKKIMEKFNDKNFIKNNNKGYYI